MNRLAAGITLLFLVFTAGLAIAGPGEQPGERFRVTPENLPKPFATDSVSNSSTIISRPPNAALQLPEGFSAAIFADDLARARWMTVAANGDVFLTQRGSDTVLLLRDADGDGRAEGRWVFAEGFSRPHGLAIQGAYLFVADTERVWRLPYAVGETAPGGPPEPVTKDGAIGGGRGHSTRNITFHPDGSRFYVAIGSGSNIGVEKAPRATVQEFRTDGTAQKTFAAGLRNPVGITFRPGSEDLYVVVNERDGLGDGLVPDYLTRVQPGGFYGWPYAYIGANPQPRLAWRRLDLVERSIVPDLLFEAHSAPLGLVFYDGDQFPAEFQGNAFVALHGSWNSSRPTGYKIVRVPFRNGKPVDYYENFATGFWAEGLGRAKVWGRPVGLAVAGDGSLLVADDAGGVVWRISYGN